MRDRVLSWRLKPSVSHDHVGDHGEETRSSIVCPKCKKTVRVRDVSHFRGHGIRIVRWRCGECEREVASDRASDLRDHLRRRHPDVPPDRMIPIWGLEPEGRGLSGRQSRADGKEAVRTVTVTTRTATTSRADPAARTSVSPEPAAPAAESTFEDVELEVGVGDVSFLSASSSPRDTQESQRLEGQGKE